MEMSTYAMEHRAALPPVAPVGAVCQPVSRPVASSQHALHRVAPLPVALRALEHRINGIAQGGTTMSPRPTRTSRILGRSPT